MKFGSQAMSIMVLLVLLLLLLLLVVVVVVVSSSVLRERWYTASLPSRIFRGPMWLQPALSSAPVHVLRNGSALASRLLDDVGCDIFLTESLIAHCSSFPLRALDFATMR